MMTPKQISNSLNQPDASMGGKVLVTTAVSRYPSVCGFNLDASLLLIHHHSYYALYNGNGTYIRDLPLEISGTAANPVWSRTDPKLVYFISGNAVKSCNVSNGVIALVKQFPEYSAVLAMGESDISQDGQFLVLAGNGKSVFLLHLPTASKSPVTDLPDIESIHMTPQNNVLVKYKTPDPKNSIGVRYRGMELFGQNLNFIRQVLPYNTHADLMTDKAGQEILIHANGNDPKPAIAAPSIVSTRLSDSVQTPIYLGDWTFVNNISCPIGQDFFIVSTYADKADGSIWTVGLDGKREELCKHGSKAFPNGNGYTWQPKANCSSDGLKVAFTSNMGLHPEIPDYTEVFLLSLAAEKPVPAPQQVAAVYDLSKYDVLISKGVATVTKAA